MILITKQHGVMGRHLTVFTSCPLPIIIKHTDNLALKQVDVDQRMAVAMSELNSEARRLYQEAIQQAGHSGHRATQASKAKEEDSARTTSLQPPRLQARGPPHRALLGGLQEMKPRP